MGPEQSIRAAITARSAKERSQPELVRGKVSGLLLSGSRALNQIRSIPPVVAARFAVMLLDQIADQLDESMKRSDLENLWQSNLKQLHAEAVSAFRTAFSLHGELLQGFRSTEPEFAFRYLLYRELFFGRQPVLASDLKDTLASFVISEENSGSSGDPLIFRGVRDKLDEMLKIGPLYIITGDTHETVVDKFLKFNHWVSTSEGHIKPTKNRYGKIVWLPRTGMELVKFNAERGYFERSPLVPGMKESEVPVVLDILQQIYKHYGANEFFTSQSRNYPFVEANPPGSYELRGEGDDRSIASFPAGVLTKPSRALFKADETTAPFLETIVNAVNIALNDRGIKHIMAKRGGLSTVDLVTSDKGLAISKIRESLLRKNEFVVFLGDRILLNGNDVDAAFESDVAIQVGADWDGQLNPPGDHYLLCSKRTASEGGTAEFIDMFTAIRRLSLTGILAPVTQHHSRVAALQQGTELNAGLPPVERRSTGQQFSEIQEIVRSLVAANTEEPMQNPGNLAGQLAERLGAVPETDSWLAEHPLEHMELLLYKRVIQGQAPVLGSDIKDTLAVFDSNQRTWFPGAREGLIATLRNGPVFLITGDSLPNLRDYFLLPDKIIEHENGHLKSSIPWLHNLHLLTRTGLDRVIFNFAKGQLERFPLVPGIAARDVSVIQQILAQTTSDQHCGSLFSEYPHEANKAPGNVDTRGEEYGDESYSFAYFPAGVVMWDQRKRFREMMTGTKPYRSMIAHIRGKLQDVGLDSILVQQGGTTTIDLTTTTKGTALAQLRQEILLPNEFLVYIGDTLTHAGNDGSTVGVADFTVQVGPEKDKYISPPPGYHHFHSPILAKDGGAARAIQAVLKARKLSGTGLWIQPPSIQA